MQTHKTSFYFYSTSYNTQIFGSYLNLIIFIIKFLKLEFNWFLIGFDLLYTITQVNNQILIILLANRLRNSIIHFRHIQRQT